MGTTKTEVAEFPARPEAVRSARQFAATVLRRWNSGYHTDMVALVVSELSTNAVRHAHTGFTLSLACNHGLVHVSVHDDNENPPRRHDSGPTSGSGRGLAIVDSVASAWGYDVVEGGKDVWADVAI